MGVFVVPVVLRIAERFHPFDGLWRSLMNQYAAAIQAATIRGASLTMLMGECAARLNDVRGLHNNNSPLELTINDSGAEQCSLQEQRGGQQIHDQATPQHTAAGFGEGGHDQLDSHRAPHH